MRSVAAYWHPGRGFDISCGRVLAILCLHLGIRRHAPCTWRLTSEPHSSTWAVRYPWTRYRRSEHNSGRDVKRGKPHTQMAGCCGGVLCRSLRPKRSGTGLSHSSRNRVQLPDTLFADCGLALPGVGPGSAAAFAVGVWVSGPCIVHIPKMHLAAVGTGRGARRAPETRVGGTCLVSGFAQRLRRAFMSCALFVACAHALALLACRKLVLRSDRALVRRGALSGNTSAQGRMRVRMVFRHQRTPFLGAHLRPTCFASVHPHFLVRRTNRRLALMSLCGESARRVVSNKSGHHSSGATPGARRRGGRPHRRPLVLRLAARPDARVVFRTLALPISCSPRRAQPGDPESPPPEIGPEVSPEIGPEVGSGSVPDRPRVDLDVDPEVGPKSTQTDRGIVPGIDPQIEPVISLGSTPDAPPGRPRIDPGSAPRRPPQDDPGSTPESAPKSPPSTVCCPPLLLLPGSGQTRPNPSQHCPDAGQDISKFGRPPASKKWCRIPSGRFPCATSVHVSSPCPKSKRVESRCTSTLRTSRRRLQACCPGPWGARVSRAITLRSRLNRAKRLQWGCASSATRHPRSNNPSKTPSHARTHAPPLPISPRFGAGSASGHRRPARRCWCAPLHAGQRARARSLYASLRDSRLRFQAVRPLQPMPPLHLHTCRHIPRNSR